MRIRLGILMVVACGPATQSSSKPSDPDEIQRKIDADQTREYQTGCDAHKTMSCVMLAKHYQEPATYSNDPKDPAKAKAILIAACKDSEGSGQEYQPGVACGTLFRDKLVADGVEAAELCKATPDACSSAEASDLMSEDQRLQLCLDQIAGCTVVEAKVTTDHEKNAEAQFLALTAAIFKMTAMAAITYGNFGGDDDASDDSACHKDTDCKGDRICTGGSCVDAPVKGAKPVVAAKPVPKLGQPECDEMIKVIAAAPSCVNAKPETQGFSMFPISLEYLWKPIAKDRYAVLAARCKEVADALPGFYAQICH